MNTTQKRLRILSLDEIETIYGRPRFTDEDRIQYWCLSQPERDVLALLRSVKSQVYFILQLGYFKAKHLFFTFDLTEVSEDVEYVLSQHFKLSNMTSLTAIDKHTRLRQQQLILERGNLGTAIQRRVRNWGQKPCNWLRFASNRFIFSVNFGIT